MVFDFLKKWKYIALFFGFITIFVINIWIEKSDEVELLFRNFLGPLLDVPKLSIVYTILIGVLIIAIYSDVIRKYEDDINKQSMAMIKTNKELGLLKARKGLLDIMEVFVKSEPHVYAVQLYNFKIKHYLSDTKIKVQYIDGYVEEEIDLNAMAQTYFTIDKRIYKEYTHALKQLELAADFVPIVRFIQTYNRMLANKSLGDITRKDLMTLSFLELSDVILEKMFGVKTGRTLDPTIEEKIKEQGGKIRTGILKGILSFKSRFFLFEYSGTGSKRRRLYLTRYINIKGEDHVFLITLDQDVLNEENSEELLDKIQDRFYNEVNKSFNLEYDTSNDSV